MAQIVVSMPATEMELVWRIAVAALCGLAVGVEREWSRLVPGRKERFAGLRTFLLLGLLAGVAGTLVASGLVVPGSALLAAAGALTIAAYVLGTRRAGGDPDGTTEMAALVVLGLGLLAGLGQLRLSSGAAALVVLVLGEKARLHRWVRRIDETELRAALHFAVLALVILPLLPAGPIAALGGTNLRTLWTVVLLFSGLNFAGYLARQEVGPTRGYGVTGLLGGLVSSTAVTLHFSRESREHPALGGPLGLGVVAACTVLLPRVLLVSVLLEPRVALLLLVYLAAPLLVGGVFVLFAILRQGPTAETASERERRSPLGLLSAIQMAVIFQVAFLAVEFVQARWGTGGILTTATLLGLTSMDALTLAMTRRGGGAEGAGLAAQAIAVGALSTTLFKLALTLALGAAPFRRVASAGLALLALATAAGLWIGARLT